ALHALADDLALEDIKRGEQRRRAMTLVVVRHGAGASLSSSAGPVGCDRAPESGSSHRPTRQSHARGIDIKANDIVQFGRELRVVGQLELAHPMRLEAVSAPYLY